MDTACKDTIEIPGYGWWVLTPWVRHTDVKPDKPGVYIASITTRNIFYRYWCGNCWYYGGHSVEEALEAYISKCSIWPNPKILFWRGLTEEPTKLPF